MAVLPIFMAAHQDYSWEEGGTADSGRPVLTSSPRLVHAALAEAPGPASPLFQNYARTGPGWRAVCGVEVLAITSAIFDEGTRRSCKKCAATVDRWLDDESLIRWEQLIPDTGRVARL
jgi:hypothetical protein